MAEPIIYTRNYIDKESLLDSAHGVTNIDRIFDTDKDSIYVTSGANSDSIFAFISATFKEDGSDIPRTINNVIIVNHNMKDIEVRYWIVGTGYVFLTALTGITASTTILSFSPVSTIKIIILAKETQIPNQEKQLGLFFACNTQVNIEPEITSLSVNYRQKQSSLLMGDGQLQRTVVMHAPNRSAKYQAKVSFRLLPDATFEILRAVKESGLAFLWQPESETKPEDIFLVHWTGPLRWSYTSKYKGAGKNMTLDLKEV